jgi:hypothetical protein
MKKALKATLSITALCFASAAWAQDVSAPPGNLEKLSSNRSHPPEASADKGGAGMRIVADLR